MGVLQYMMIHFCFRRPLNPKNNNPRRSSNPLRQLKAGWNQRKNKHKQKQKREQKQKRNKTELEPSWNRSFLGCQGKVIGEVGNRAWYRNR